MSRKIKLPLLIPENVECILNNNNIAFIGPKGKVEKNFKNIKIIKIILDNNKLNIINLINNKFSKAMIGTCSSIIVNMILGVTNEFKKNLEVRGVGFKIEKNQNQLKLLLGYSHPIYYTIPDNVKIEINDTKITVIGCDKQLIGEVAAKIKSYYPVEPYKGKGIRILGEFIRSKEGKKTS